MIKLKDLIMEMPVTRKTSFGAHVDESLVKHIEELNRLGFKTRACCSGLRQDHPEGLNYDPGYISFSSNLERGRAKKIRDAVRGIDGLSFEVYKAYPDDALKTGDKRWVPVVAARVKIGRRATIEMWDQFVRNLGGKV